MQKKRNIDTNARTAGSTYLVGLRDAVRGNAQAFGFSILITTTYGVVSASSPAPTAAELFGFALASVAAFSLLNLLVAALTRNSSLSSESTRIVLVATATDFLAVAAGIGAAFGVRGTMTGWGVWVLAPFTAAIAYMLVQSLELAVGHRGAGE